MYQFSYDEIVEDCQAEARLREGAALDKAIALLEAAAKAGPESREAVDALFFLRRLWTIFLDDVVEPGNGLPEALKSQLVSIGFWMLKEIEEIRAGRSVDFAGVIEINAIIREGLK